MSDRPQLLAGLLARRAQTATLIKDLEAQLRVHTETLRCLDHLIRIEDPEAELPIGRAVRTKSAGKATTSLVRGDLSKGSLDALREASGKTLSSRQVAEHIATRHGMSFSTNRENNDFVSGVTMALSRLAKRELVELTGRGENRTGLWRIKKAA